MDYMFSMSPLECFWFLYHLFLGQKSQVNFLERMLHSTNVSQTSVAKGNPQPTLEEENTNLICDSLFECLFSNNVGLLLYSTPISVDRPERHLSGYCWCSIDIRCKRYVSLELNTSVHLELRLRAPPCTILKKFDVH